MRSIQTKGHPLTRYPIHDVEPSTNQSAHTSSYLDQRARHRTPRSTLRHVRHAWKPGVEGIITVGQGRSMS
jgi:hypothetical protein